jgi:hypothetical protein
LRRGLFPVGMGSRRNKRQVKENDERRKDSDQIWEGGLREREERHGKYLEFWTGLVVYPYSTVDDAK